MNPLRTHAFLALLLVAMALAPAARASDSPFEPQLIRLSEVLGSLHFLRNLCGEPGMQWRGQMEALLEAEAPGEARRARMIASFNRGYRAFADSYATCTESAIEAIRRYMAEGHELARETAARYGN